MKKLLYSLFAVLFCIANGWSQTATINLNSTAQVIKGFGGINHPEWYSDLNAAERQLAFGNGTGQLGLTVLRTYVSDNSANFGRGIETAKYAYNNGALVFASPWNPPAGQYITVNGVKRINPATYAQYADHLNSYVTYMKNNGVNLYAISTQNEPDYAHDWTEWSPQESVNFIKGYRNRINCKLMTPESFQYRKNVYDPILNDPTALANVDIFGTHLYGTPYSSFPYPLFKQKGAGKELWMTEVYTDSKYDGNIWSNSFINDDRHALKVAEHIHYAMVEGEFQTYVFWPLRRYYALIHDGNSDGQGNTPGAAGTATKRGYCMAQFSKWVRPGYVRVDATKSPATNVFVSAYKNGNDVVIVVINKNTSTRTITLSIPGTQVTTWEQYTTSASKSLAKGNNISASTSFQVTLDQASITTFVGKANNTVNTPPTVSLTSPAANASFTAPATINIAATASDANGTVSSVAFYNGSTLLGTDATAPYSYTWTNVAAGTYSITARATDNGGATTTSTAVSVSVTGTVNTPPTVSLTSPAANASFTAPATINIAANASDANGTVSSVAFYNGTTLLGTDATTPYSYTWTNVAAGTYSITARATDNAGATTTSTAISVTVTGVTSTDPIIGPSCGSNNTTITFSLNSLNRGNVTSYNWWYTGSAASTAAVSGAPYSITMQTGANFSAGQVCVGTNLSVSPWYVQHCKSISKCAGARMSVDEFGVETLTSTEITPNPSTDNFSVTAAGDVSKILVFNETGQEVYHHGSLEKGTTISIGNELVEGLYLLTIQYIDGTTETKRIVKMK